MNQTSLNLPINATALGKRFRTDEDPVAGIQRHEEQERKAKNIFAIASEIDVLLKQHKTSKREIQSILKLIASQYDLKVTSEYSVPTLALQKMEIKNKEKPNKGKGKKEVKQQPSNPEKKRLRAAIDSINAQIKQKSSVSGVTLSSSDPLIQQRAKLFAELKASAAGSNPQAKDVQMAQ